MNNLFLPKQFFKKIGTTVRGGKTLADVSLIQNLGAEVLGDFLSTVTVALVTDTNATFTTTVNDFAYDLVKISGNRTKINYQLSLATTLAGHTTATDTIRVRISNLPFNPDTIIKSMPAVRVATVGGGTVGSTTVTGNAFEIQFDTAVTNLANGAIVFQYSQTIII